MKEQDYLLAEKLYNAKRQAEGTLLYLEELCEREVECEICVKVYDDNPMPIGGRNNGYIRPLPQGLQEKLKRTIKDILIEYVRELQNIIDII